MSIPHSFARSLSLVAVENIVTALRLCINSSAAAPAQFVQRRHRRLRKVLGGVLIRGKLLPTPHRSWRKRAGGHLTRGQRHSSKVSDLSLCRQSSDAHDGERTGRKSQASAHRMVEPGVPLPETWSIPFVMPAQPTPDECRYM